MTEMVRPVELSTTSLVAFESVREVLLTEPGAVFGDDSSVEAQRDRPLSMNLGVALGAGASVHQVVELELGVSRVVDDKLVLPMEWRASGHERLLPTFKGALEASEAGGATCLHLTGDYRVPLGVLGRFGDGVLGRRLARQSLERLLEQVAARLEGEVRRRLELATLDPTGRPST